MFELQRKQSRLRSFFNIMRLIHVATVRNVRKTQRTPLMSLLMNMMQTLMFVMAFLVMFQILGMRGAAIRGDFVLYIMSGIFLFMTHTTAMGAVSGAEGPTSPMMQHAPMNTIISICAAALSSLYTQLFSMAVILFGYYIIFTPFEIYDPISCLGMVLLAWGSGCALGLVVLAAKPWAPAIIGIFSTVYQRANMIASGKMFVANTLPKSMLVMFDWNPLFHTIDQARGFAFINYIPRNSSAEYPLKVTVALLAIGLVLEFYTRQYASSSWSTKS